ncbi:MAG: hypothetical protein GF317_23055 [Candidatus Lokiarchaeota archaeon]|nr:hypothetical protein [Candidatus Lokiarchaeota archaeon]MBD3202323.1 hypothetical protein [Candidatus Lokiarchaeota archaeon]
MDPKEFQTKKSTISSKYKGKIKIKTSDKTLSLKGEKIELKDDEYVKMIGITTCQRTPLYCSNKTYEYLLELTNNLDFISTSILGGELDKMMLVSEATKEKEKCQFFVKDEIIYLVYGKFPDKKGKWMLEQIANHYKDIIGNNDPDQLEKFEKYQIDTKFQAVMKFILQEYLKLQDVFTDQEIPYVEDKIRIDYLGLSSMSIGVISLLLGDELNVEVPGNFDDPEERREMKESLLTAKIEAIAANTLGNTGAVPQWIAVKLGFQNYRFLTFQEFSNNYFLYLLSEGNLEKLKIVENVLEPKIVDVTQKPFSGNLKPFNKLRKQLKNMFEENRSFS